MLVDGRKTNLISVVVISRKFLFIVNFFNKRNRQELSKQRARILY